MTFAADLKNQIPAILDQVSNGIQELHVVRNFVRDRCQIEREYAQKLDNLSRKYMQNIKLPAAEDNDEADWNNDMSSATFAWASIISQTGQIAKCRFKLVEDLTASVVDVLKATAARKEDARKKHVAFYNKLKVEKEKTFAEKDKARQAYEDACNEVVAINTKLTKGSGDQDKYQKQLDQAGLDCNNKKNLYILALSVANAEKEKFYEEDLPSLADHLQSLDSSRIYALQNIFTTYIGMETGTIVSVQNHYCKALDAVGRIDPVADSSAYIRNSVMYQNDNDSMATTPFVFVPWNGGGAVMEQDVNLSTDESSAVFLNNKLIKNRKQLEDIGDELSRSSTELMQLERAVNAITNKASAEYDRATERLMETARHITLLSTQKVRVKSEVDLIIQSIGVSGMDAQSHDFKASSFTIPTTCDFCGNTIWGLSKQGLTCKSCGLNCHAKCEMNVSPNCSHVRGKIHHQTVPVYRPKLKQVVPSKSVETPVRSPTKQVKANKEAQAVATATAVAGTAAVASVASTASEQVASNIPQSNPSIATVAAQKTDDVNPAAPIRARALYSYDAQTEDELSLTEGEVLAVVGTDDTNGWMKVTRGNQVGFVPANYMAVEDNKPPETLQENVATDQQEDTPPSNYVTALYDFEAVNADELNIREGDKILVTRRDDSGWWEGTLNGRTGVFPANYVK